MIRGRILLLAAYANRDRYSWRGFDILDSRRTLFCVSDKRLGVTSAAVLSNGRAHKESVGVIDPTIVVILVVDAVQLVAVLEQGGLNIGKVGVMSAFGMKTNLHYEHIDSAPTECAFSSGDHFQIKSLGVRF